VDQFSYFLPLTSERICCFETRGEIAVVQLVNDMLVGVLKLSILYSSSPEGGRVWIRAIIGHFEKATS